MRVARYTGIYDVSAALSKGIETAYETVKLVERAYDSEIWSRYWVVLNVA